MNHQEFALKVAHRAGQIMLKYFRNPINTSQWKSDDTPVTIADKQINKYVRKQVSEIFPEHGFIGEEGSDYSKQQLTWICDPIDGTRSFSRGIPAATFSLALLNNGQPILGVVYQPFIDEIYFASKGSNSTRNGHKIQVSTIAQISREVGIACPSHRINTPFFIDDKISDLAIAGVSAYNYGSAAYNAVLVACGSAEGTMFPWTSGYDMAAAKIIIEQAGGKTSNLYGDAQRYDKDIKGFAGTNGLLHEHFLL